MSLSIPTNWNPKRVNDHAALPVPIIATPTTVSLWLWCLTCLWCCSWAVAADRPPNIVLIIADDVGIEGLGCYGGVSYQTPVLDELARTGVRFTHAYSQPLCTPTRVQLMTGKYNHRNWTSFGILDPSETTLGHRLSKAGYATAIYGKWQLYSYDPIEFPGARRRRSTGMHPKDAGFDEYALFHAGHTEDKGSRYANPTMLEGRAGEPGVLKTYDGRYGEDVWVEQAIDFLDRQRDRPTFVYYPMALPHNPFVPTPNSSAWDPRKPQPESVDYAADMIEYMDTAVGNLVDGLESKGLRENTIMIFYSDNGTNVKVVSRLADGRAIQGGKATPKQTGIHAPLIVSWPGHIQPAVVDSLIDASDFVPTLLELAGQPLTDDADTAENDLDGISFAADLFGRAGPRRQAVFVWYDPRPGWDKERFSRHVFAMDKRYKYFRDGRLFRLTDRPLEEVPVHLATAAPQELAAVAKLKALIDRKMRGVTEPSLVDAFGRRLE